LKNVRVEEISDVRFAGESAGALPVEAAINSLIAMKLADLREVWEREFGAPPDLRSVPLLRLQLAWRLQARTFGGIDPVVQRKLKRKTSFPREELLVCPGSILNRNWKGEDHTVEVVTEGFCWNGKQYASLSAVAFAITGTRWNGPRFFGLRQNKR
jgi:hypothetical protein